MKVGKVEISHPDKVLYPKSKITKGDLLEYYKKASKRIIYLIKNRPLTMHRFPNGIKEEGFFQKNISDFFPSWVKSAAVARKEEKSIRMVLCNDQNTLLYIVNLGCLALHVWPSQIQKANYPDRMIFDLDPGKRPFRAVIEAAADLRQILEDELELSTFVMTTGSKGIHIVVPIKPIMTFDDVRAFAKTAAQILSSRKPDKYTIEPRKQSRKGRLFIDYLRNGYGQMAIAPYSTRALEKAPIATPIEWKELSQKGFSSQHFHIGNIEARLKKKCPWEKINASSSNLKSRLKKLEKTLIKRHA